MESDYIQLDQLLKACRMVNSGGEAHMLVEEGLVKLNGKTETRKRAKIRIGDVVEVEGQRVRVVAQ